MSVEVQKRPGMRFVVDFLGKIWGLRIRENFVFLKGRILDFKLFLIDHPTGATCRILPYDGGLVDTIHLEDLKEVLLYTEHWLKANCKGSPKEGWRLGGLRPL